MNERETRDDRIEGGRRPGRRAFLHTLGTGAAVGLTGCLGASSGATALRPWSALSFDEQLEAVRRATGPYDDVTVAERDGYRAIPTPEGCGTVFYDRLDWGRNRTLDALQPEALLYTVGSASTRLAAVEYRHPIAERESQTPPNLFTDDTATGDAAEEAGWSRLFLDAESYTGLLWALTVWVHQPNPAGVFAASNPAIGAEHTRACGHGLVGL